MVLSDTTQTLVAAFSFGILLQTALSAVLLYFSGHGATIFKEGRRLVLVIFLLTSMLWSLFEFINFNVPKPAARKFDFCQATVVVSSSLDQIARVAIGGFLLWTIGHNTKTSGEKYGLGVLVTIRALAGGLFVGFVRPQFKPLCLARSSLLPVAFGVLVLDVIIIGVLFTRIFTLGLWRTMRQDIPGTHQTICKSLMFVLIGFVIWTAASVAMILGFESTIFLFRTAVAAIGLTILISITALYPGVLLLEREEESRITQEARSPFAAPPSQSGESFSSQSPIIPRRNNNGGLFVVNPSDTPNNSSRVDSSNPRNLEDDGSRKYVPNRVITQMEIDDSGTKDINRKHTSSGVFGNIHAPPVVSTAGSQSQDNIQNLPKATIVSTAYSLPANPFLDPLNSPPKKKGIFGRSVSPPKKSVRMEDISAPIVIDVDAATETSFTRMRTVDLATAAASDRERRQNGAAKALIASRPAPRPPKSAGPEDLKMSISTRRKQTKSIRVPGASTPPGAEGGLLVNSNTSGASLSPGIEEIRRRSPRNAVPDHYGLDKFEFADTNRGRTKTQIRAQPPPDLRRLDPLRMQQPNQETVMYMKDIVYDQPGMVDSIMSGVPAMIAKAKKTPITPLETPQSSTSIMQRPRPYKRGPETDGAFFKNEASSPHHRRSQSGGAIPTNSVVNGKSALIYRPRSPTGLPAWPPVPTSASRLKRILPNDTHSMTIDEKMLLLFPAPLGVSEHKRTSSVPLLPRIPSFVFQGESMGLNAGEPDTADRRASNRTSMSFSVAPDLNPFSPKRPSPVLVENISPRTKTPVTNRAEDGYTYRFSARTYGSLLKSPHDSWVTKIPEPEIPAFLESNNPVTEDVKSESADVQDGSKSGWTSLHPSTPATGTQGSYANAINMGLGSSTINADSDIPELSTVADNTISKSSRSEFITFELARNSPPTGNYLPVFVLDASPSLPDEQPSKSTIGNTWHHRLGDDLPTFSGRKESRLRGMPPPPPLLLSSNSRQAKLRIKEVIDTPGRAIQQIQAQLKQFEAPDRDSLANILDNLPGAVVKTPSGRNADRLGLLANLEAEMAGQENQWMQMQHDFDRDSNSVMILSPAVQDLKSRGHTSPPPESEVPSRASSRLSSIQSTRNKSSRSTATAETADTISTQSSQKSRSSVWQRRLAEAEMEYTENAPESQMKQNLNFFSLKKSLSQPGSPSPPESVDSADDSTQFDSEPEAEDESAVAKSIAALLWKSKSLLAPIIKGYMWTGAEQSVREISPEPPAKSIRPTMRKIQQPLMIESSNLWSKTKMTCRIPPVGLWGTKLSRPVSIITRPKTQRPQRKGRRITLLADIVESPSPLPNKRETLGIYQFPWGEVSDHPIYRQPPRLPQANLLRSDMLSSSPGTELRILESDEYESSFFDDYDDIEDYESEEPQAGDDGFDESTLWEIADLLQCQDVPSRSSLLPSKRVSVIEGYDDSGSEDEIVESTNRKPSLVKFIPIQPLRMTPSPQTSPLFTPQQPLWIKDPEAPVLPPKDTGLLRPQAYVWQSYIPTHEPVRVKSRDSLTLQSLTSGETLGIDMTLPKQLDATLWVGNGKMKSEQESTQISTTLLCEERGQIVPTRTASLGPPNPWSPEVSPAASNITGLGGAVNGQLEQPYTQQSPRRTSSKLSSSPDGELESKGLWDKAIVAVTSMNTANKDSSNLWTAKPTARAMTGTMTSAKLWTPREHRLVTQAASLFIKGVEKTDFHTDKSCVALKTIRKPHSAAEMLTTLTTSTLWSPLSINTDIHEPNWIAKATALPLSRATSISGDDSNVHTADFDEVSLSSANTKAFSFWSSKPTSAADSSLDSRDVTVASPDVDVQMYTNKLPIKTLSKRLSNTQLPAMVSRHLADGGNGKGKPAVEGFKATTDSYVSKPAIKAKKSTGRIMVTREQWIEALNQAVRDGTPQVRRPGATKAQWEQALNEALKNSTPRLQRPQATPEDWKVALSAAMSYVPVTSQPSLPQFHVSVQHPGFFNASTSPTQPGFILPVLKGYIKPAVSQASLRVQPSTSQFDVSIRHPAFFTTCFTTKAYSVHPAMEGYVRPSIKTQSSTPRQASIALWHPTVPVEETKSEALWISKPVIQEARPSLFEQLAVMPGLRRNNAATTAIPALASNTLWQKEKKVVAIERHWLHETSKTSPIWTGALISSSEITNTPLWAKQAGERQEMFADLLSRPVVKRQIEVTESLPMLTSKAFWQSETKTVVVAKRWLEMTKKKSPLWNKTPVLQGTPNEIKGLWALQSHARPEIFTKNNSTSIRKARSHTDASLPVITSLSLFEKSNRGTNETTERHWLHTTCKSNTPKLRQIGHRRQNLNKAAETDTRASAWLAAPERKMSAKGKTFVAPPAIRTSTTSRTQPILESGTPISELTLAPTVFQPPLPKRLLKRTQTLPSTGRNSIWTAPTLASIKTPKRTPALWNPSAPVAPGALRPKSPEDTFATSNRALEVAGLRTSRSNRSMRLSRVMEDQEARAVESEKKRISTEGQKTWRPNWGLPERPTQWLEQGKEKRRVVEFRY